MLRLWSTLLGVFSCLQMALAQSVAMEVTLTSKDITSIPMSTLFPPSNSATKKGMLGQAPVTTYNTSHPAAIVSKLGEQLLQTNIIPFGTNSLDAWAYRTGQTDLYALSDGTLYIIDYAIAGGQRTVKLQYPAIPVKAGTVCTGLDFSATFIVVGCLSADQKSATLFSIVNQAITNTQVVNFDQGYEITGRLKVDLSLDSSYLTMFDDMTVSNGNEAIYTFAVNLTDFTFQKLSTLTQVAGSNLNSVTDAFIDIIDADYFITIHMIDSITKNLEINYCGVAFDPVAGTSTLSNCQELGIGALNIKAGRSRLFNPSSGSFVLIFDNTVTSSPLLRYCTKPSGSNLYSSCISSIRGLPFWDGTNIFASSITNYNGNAAINFMNTQTKQIWTILDIMTYQATGTMAVGFDTIIEPAQLGTFVVYPMDAYVNFPTVSKFYGDVGPANYALQITAMDMPAPTSGSTVKLRRALIQVTMTAPGQSAVSVWVRVVVLDTMTSLMGFSDQLPDFGGLTGGYLLTNMDRSWFYGNNLQLTYSGSSLTQTSILDKIPVTIALSNSPSVTKIFIRTEDEIVASDATNMYYYRCFEGKSNTSNCNLLQTIPLTAGYSILRVYNSVSFPEINQSLGCIIITTNGAGSAIIYYINRQTPTTAATQVTFGDSNTFRDIHMINYLGTLMFFTAPLTGQDAGNVLVYSTQDPITSTSTFSVLGRVTAAMYGIPVPMVPDKIKSCGHNDNVVEFLTGTGYIAKTWVKGANQAGLTAKPLVRIVNNNIPTFKAVNFCPMGDEFIVWDNNGNIFSTSTAPDNTYYDLGLQEFGLVSITGVTCARLSASAGVWGKDGKCNTWVATLYGNQFNTAQTKIHSVYQWPSNVTPDFADTFEYTISGIAHVTVKNGAITCLNVELAGPYFLTGFNTAFTDPNLYLTLTAVSANPTQTRNIVKQLNLQVINTALRIETSGTPPPLMIGSFDLEQNNTIIGHMAQASVNVPPALVGVVTVSQRYNMLAPQKALTIDQVPLNMVSVLDSTPSCTVYYSNNPSNNQTMISVRGNGPNACANSDSPISLFAVTSISAKIEQDTNTAVVAYVVKNGGEYFTYVAYVSLTNAGQITTMNLFTDMGYITTVKIGRVPNQGGMIHAIFVGVRIHDRWDVYRADQTGKTLTYWDSIFNCYNLWPVNTSDGLVALYNNYHSSSLNVYTLANANPSTSGFIQPGLTFDGTYNEYLDIKCFKVDGLAYTVQCGMVTFGANVIIGYIQMNGSLIVQGVSTYSLFNYQDTTHSDSGSYIGLSITPGWVALKSLDGHVDVFSLDFEQQGYMYTRIPDPSSVSAKNNLKGNLKYSLIHANRNLNFGITCVDNQLPSVQLIAPTSQQDGTQIQWYQIQHLTLQLTANVTQEQANQIQINLGSPAKMTSFNVSTFIGPVPPVPPGPVPPGPDPKPEPEPEKGSKAWIWITLLIIVIIALIGGAVYYFMVVKKRGTTETEDRYYKSGEVLSEVKKEDRKQSDEFS